jgi:hypothetical protein
MIVWLFGCNELSVPALPQNFPSPLYSDHRLESVECLFSGRLQVNDLRRHLFLQLPLDDLFVITGDTGKANLVTFVTRNGKTVTISAKLWKQLMSGGRHAQLTKLDAARFEPSLTEFFGQYKEPKSSHVAFGSNITTNTKFGAEDLERGRTLSQSPFWSKQKKQQIEHEQSVMHWLWQHILKVLGADKWLEERLQICKKKQKHKNINKTRRSNQTTAEIMLQYHNTIKQTIIIIKKNIDQNFIH